MNIYLVGLTLLYFVLFPAIPNPECNIEFQYLLESLI